LDIWPCLHIGARFEDGGVKLLVECIARQTRRPVQRLARMLRAEERQLVFRVLGYVIHFT
jgi:hypothetical protein